MRRFLWLARVPYGIGVWWRNRAFDRGRREIHRVSVPIVSVGNLTVGGTGKTPCVEYIARFYREQGLQVGILSRGYGSDNGRNDEAMLLEENLPDVPHLQGRDRVELARVAIEELESEILILDDGFQHRRLYRDLEVVLIDATEPEGLGYLFPRGTLREPMRNLRRADLVMVTRCDRIDEKRYAEITAMVRRWNPSAPLIKTVHQPLELLGSDGGRESVELLKNRPVLGFCGIGNPEAFRQTLLDLGAEVKEFRVFPDHHPYTRDDVEDLERWAARHPEGTLIATTQKDAVKLRIPQLGERPLWAVRIGLAFLEGQSEFDDRLRSVMASV